MEKKSVTTVQVQGLGGGVCSLLFHYDDDKGESGSDVGTVLTSTGHRGSGNVNYCNVEADQQGGVLKRKSHLHWHTHTNTRAHTRVLTHTHTEYLPKRD